MSYFQINQKTFFIILLVISMIIWGGAWPVGKLLSSYGSVSNIVSIRFMMVVISMIPFMVAYKIDFSIQRNGIVYMVLAGLLMAIYSLLFLKGLSVGFAGAGGVLVTTLNPIFAYSIGLLLEKRIPNKNEKIGLLIGFIGGLIQLEIWSKADKIFEGGNLYFLIASFTWAAMSKFSSKSTKYAQPISFSFWIYIVTVMALSPFVDYSQIGEIVKNADTNFWILMFYASTIGTSLATSVYLVATSKLGAEQASSFIFLVPLSAACTAFFMLGEEIKFHTFMGGCIGILAIYMLNRKK